MSNILLHLEALIESIDKIERYSCEFNDADELYHDSKSFDAVMMQFVVIGESISRMDEDFKKNQNQIPCLTFAPKPKHFLSDILHYSDNTH